MLLKQWFKFVTMLILSVSWPGSNILDHICAKSATPWQFLQLIVFVSWLTKVSQDQKEAPRSQEWPKCAKKHQRCPKTTALSVPMEGQQIPHWHSANLFLLNIPTKLFLNSRRYLQVTKWLPHTCFDRSFYTVVNIAIVAKILQNETFFSVSD